MVPQALSSHRAWYCRRSHRATRSDTGAVVVPCVVSQGLLSCHTWCHRGCHRAMCGVAGGVVRLRGHMVAVAMLRAVSRSLLLRRVMLSSRPSRCAACCPSQSSHHVWCRSHDRHAAWCHKSVVSGLKKVGVSRKRKKKTYEQREASASTVTQCMQP
jgi:hypothetical protein